MLVLLPLELETRVAAPLVPVEGLEVKGMNGGNDIGEALA